MYENIAVLLILAAAVALLIVKISKSFSGNKMACGCCPEKGCSGCGDLDHGQPQTTKKQPGTGSGSL
jgi:hypothetical protein